MIRAGTLNRRITIEAKTVVKDPEYSSEIVAWVPFASRIAANVQDVLPSKTEAVKQGAELAPQRARVRIRYRHGIKPDMRIVVHGDIDRVMEIVGGPAELGLRDGLEMMVESYRV